MHDTNTYLVYIILSSDIFIVLHAGLCIKRQLKSSCGLLSIVFISLALYLLYSLQIPIVPWFMGVKFTKHACMHTGAE